MTLKDQKIELLIDKWTKTSKFSTRDMLSEMFDYAIDLAAENCKGDKYSTSAFTADRFIYEANPERILLLKKRLA